MAELFIAVLMFGESIVIVFMAIIVAAPFVLTVLWLALAHYVAGRWPPASSASPFSSA